MSWNQEEKKVLQQLPHEPPFLFFLGKCERKIPRLSSFLGERKKMRKRVTKIPVSSSPWRNRWKHMRERERGKKLNKNY